MKRLAILAVLVAAVGCKSRDDNRDVTTPATTTQPEGTYTSTNPTGTPSTSPGTSDTTMPDPTVAGTNDTGGTGGATTGGTTSDTTTGTASGTTGTTAGGTTPSATGSSTGSTATTGRDTRDTGGTAGGQANPSTDTMGSAAQGSQRSSVSFTKSADSEIDGTLDIIKTDNGLTVSGNFANAPKDRTLELSVVDDCTSDAKGQSIGTLDVQTDGSVKFDGSEIAAMDGKSLAVREQGKTKPIACAAITKM